MFLAKCLRLTRRNSFGLIKVYALQEPKTLKNRFFTALKLFCYRATNIQNSVVHMNPEQAKTANKALNELSENYIDLIHAVKSTANSTEAAKKLWREGNKSRLIELGIALIIFPEPTAISEVIGAGFIAAGTVKKGLQCRSLYLEDVTKTFKNTMKSVLEIRNSVKI